MSLILPGCSSPPPCRSVHVTVNARNSVHAKKLIHTKSKHRAYPTIISTALLTANLLQLAGYPHILVDFAGDLVELRVVGERETAIAATANYAASPLLRGSSAPISVNTGRVRVGLT